MAKTPQTSTHKVGQHNVRVLGLDIHNPVFFISGALIVAFVFFTLVFKDSMGGFLSWLRPYLTSNLDWFLMIAANIFVIFCLLLIISPYGKVKLGGKNAKPDYSYPGWLAMLFAAGMGIGLMFFGVLEPVNHTLNPPLGIEAGTEEAVRAGMAATIFHWGLHPWAIYAVVALSLAFFSYNRGLPLSVRSIFFPILKERTWGWSGHVVDILAVFATIFGLATSLGFGATQALAGMNYLFGVEVSDGAKVILISGITGLALISVMAGLDKGVKRLSELNMVLAGILLLAVLILGPTLALITGFFTNIVDYFRYLPALSNWVGREDVGFSQGWTAFYWAWWISWSPFVGMFIARVSKGRSVREFLTCVLIVPSLVCVFWMTVFGGTAISQMLGGYTGVQETVSAWQPELSLFRMVELLPFSGVLSFIGIVLVVVFFTTSSDSGSLVIDTITAGGKTDAPTQQRVFWCLLEGAIAIALLLGGGLGSLQAAAIATGLPFAAVLLVMCVSLWMGLKDEER